MARRVWEKVGPGKFFLLFGLSLLFGLTERVNGQGALPLHLLAVLNDQYYFTFGVLPVFLFLCAGVMEVDTLLVLTRYGTYGRYFFHKWRALSGIAALFWLGQMAAVLLSGLGLPVAGGWPEVPGGLWGEVFTLLRGYFPSLWAAILCCAGQVLLGYWLIALTALCLGHFCGRSLAVKLLVGLYLFAVLWLQLPVMSRPPLVFLTGINHWVFLLHNLAQPWRLPLTAVTTAVLAAGMVWLVTRRWRWRPSVSGRGGHGLASYYRRILFTGKNGLVLIGLVALVTVWTWIAGGAPEDGTDWLIRLFAGHGTGYFYPMGLLTLLTIELLPLWPLGGFCTQMAGERSVFLTVRAAGGAPSYRASLAPAVRRPAGARGRRAAPAAGPVPELGLDRGGGGAEAFGRRVSISADPGRPLRDGAGNGWICDRLAAAFSLRAAHSVAAGGSFQPGAAGPSPDGRNRAGRGCRRAAGGPVPGPDPLAFPPGRQAAVQS